jgi:hypothetical protein
MWSNEQLPFASKTEKTEYYIDQPKFLLMKQLIVVLGRAERVTRAVEGSSYVTIHKPYTELERGGSGRHPGQGGVREGEMASCQRGLCDHLQEEDEDVAQDAIQVA